MTPAQEKEAAPILGNESDPQVFQTEILDFAIEEELETDEFDNIYSVPDFGYSSYEFTVFPPLKTDVCSIGNMVQQEASIPAADLEHLGSVRRQQLLGVIRRYPNLFDEDAPLGCLPGIRHGIRTEDTQPIRTCQWRLPESACATIHKECNQMLADGITEPSKSPWFSPVVLVKKDGGIRFCVDYRNIKIIIYPTLTLCRD